MKFSRKLGGALAAVAVITVTGLGSASTATADPTPGTPGPSSTHKVPKKKLALMASDAPKTVVLDSATGEVLSVEEETAAGVAAAITVRSPCQAGDACWNATAIPYAIYGFAGTGTKTGTWYNRSEMFTHAHSTSVCWVYGGNSHCSPRVGTNSKISFSVYPVTGKSVTNYT